MLTMAVGVSTAQEPQITPFSPAGTPAAAPGAPNPDAVLWDQYAGWTGVDYAAQDFETSYDIYDIYAGDDFESFEPWSIETITTRGGWGGYVNISGAHAIHWYIYPDAGGEPAGVPGDGSEFWSISLAPSDPQVQLGVFEAEDVVLTLDTAVDLPAGTWWLVYYVSLDYAVYGQYGWSGNLATVWGQVGMQNNPGGGFGLPPGWNLNDYGEDFMFRLEGSVGGEPTMHVHRIAMRAVALAAGYGVMSQVRIFDEFGVPVEGADVYVDFELPDGRMRPLSGTTAPNGWARMRAKTPMTGVHEVCVTDVVKAGLVYDPSQNNMTCETLEIFP
jgi:hypothetical protein